MIDYNCLLCKKEIDDHGALFCSKCRKKDWKIRFIAIQKKEKERMWAWKSKTFLKKTNFKTSMVIKDYWERRRNEYG